MIKRYKTTKDNTITNSYTLATPAAGTTRATGSNMGASDILETFTIYGSVGFNYPTYDPATYSPASVGKELQRIIIQFDVDSLIADRNSGTVPSGSSYYLKMFNAVSADTLPTDFTLDVSSLSEAWQEGFGLDMNLPYADHTYDIKGSNWIRRSGDTSWSTEGAITDTGLVYSASCPTGLENIELNITPLVNQWISGDITNCGVGIRFSPSLEEMSASYYTKKFYSRSTSEFFDRPVLEARWDSSVRDDRGQFYTSSSLVPAADNLNTLYLYNYSRGRLQDIPAVLADGNHEIRVALYDSGLGTAFTLCNEQSYYTGGRVSKGIYSASVCVDTLSSSAFDVWYLGSDEFHTGSINAKSLSAHSYVDTTRYVLSVSNKNTSYEYSQTHRIRLYARQKDWSPNIYNTATTVPNALVFESASYQVYRVVDDRVVIPYGTGSSQATRLSYDVSGNYFDLDTSMLEPNYTYGINFSIYDPDTLSYEQQPYMYKIRVVKNEY